MHPGARRQINVFLAIVLFGCSASLLAQEKSSVPPRPNFAATLQLDRTLKPEASKPSQPVAERSLPSLLLSPAHWTEAVRELSLESKPALMHFYWTGQPMMFERHNLYYARSSLSYTKGIILTELAHGRMDLGLYKGRVTLEQTRIYGMGPQLVSNPIVGNQIRLFRNPLLENVDKVFVMIRFHLTPRRAETPPNTSPQ